MECSTVTGLRKVAADELVERLTQPQIVGERIDFRHCHISESVNLAGRTVCGFDFSNSRFDAEVDFTGARFEGLSWFIGSRFHGNTQFAAACFSNDARFDQCVFDSNAGFSGIEFRGIGAFDDAHFKQQIDFFGMVAYGNVSLQNARVSGGLILENAILMGGLWSPDAELAPKLQVAGLDVHGRQYPQRF